MRPLSLRFLALFALFIGGLSAPRYAIGGGVLIPANTWRHFIFDHAGHYLYMTMSDGWLRRYNLATAQMENGYYLGGRLNGFDIAPDDSFLLVAQGEGSDTQSIVHKINLATGTITNIISSTGGGTADVAIASNGIAFVTTFGVSNSPFTNLLQIDLATNTASVRSDTPGWAAADNKISSGALIIRSKDGHRLCVSEATALGNGHCFTYSADTNTFSPRGEAGSARTALNRNGSIMATGIINSLSLDSVPGYNFLHVFSHLGGGVTFDAVTDTVYAQSTFSDEIIAYDTNTFLEKFRLIVGEGQSFDQTFNGFEASDDGKHLALATASGIRLFKIPANVTGPPAPALDVPVDMVFDHTGQHLYISTLLGFIWPYNLRTGQFETPYNLGGSLNGLDIAPDDSFLLVAQYDRGVSQGVAHKVDLNSRQVTNLTYPINSNQGGTWDVAIASNGLALFIVRSADRTRIAVLEGNTQSWFYISGSGWVPLRISNSPRFMYDATQNSFSGPAKIRMGS